MKVTVLASLYLMSIVELSTAIPSSGFDAPTAPADNFNIEDISNYQPTYLPTTDLPTITASTLRFSDWRKLYWNYANRNEGYMQPASVNLMVGREDNLSATSTCGLNGEVRYCVLSALDYKKRCFRCDSRKNSSISLLLNHRVENIVQKVFPRTQQRSWWQSENGIENVSIRLDLESKFLISHALLKFKSTRPAAMLIESSSDFGNTWTVLKYFAEDCKASFPEAFQNNIPCDTRFSSLLPSTEGEIIYLKSSSPVPLGSTLRLDTLKSTTNVRFNFTKTHTLHRGQQAFVLAENPNSGMRLNHFRPMHFTKDEESNYYAIYEIILRGSVNCNGHASRVVPQNPEDSKFPGKVHGKCSCRHNTEGNNCEKCDNLYNNLPWKAATPENAYACKKCECNNHATTCHFDPEVYEASQQISGGVCDDCHHNTMGNNCNQCKPGFYIAEGKTISDADACKLIQE